jgi:hypothetical protein
MSHLVLLLSQKFNLNLRQSLLQSLLQWKFLLL